MMGSVLVVLAVVVGYPIQRHYLQKRYADPSFTTPGLNAAFAWARDVSGARIATTSTRQYPLFGTDLSNHVQFIGTERPHGGFEAPQTCPEWRRRAQRGPLRLRGHLQGPRRTRQAPVPRPGPLDANPPRQESSCGSRRRCLQAQRSPLDPVCLSLI